MRGLIVGFLAGALCAGLGIGVWLYAAPGAAESSQEGAGQKLFSANEGGREGRVYTDPIGFSLTLPGTLSGTAIDEGGGSKTLIFENPDADPPEGFQIFITPYESAQITQERMKLDTHATLPVPPQEVVLGSGTRAIVFMSEDPVLGELREVWFLHGGYLFEVTTFAARDAWLSGILNTLTFSP